MYLISNIFVNTFSVMILLVISIYLKKYSEMESIQNRLFYWIVNAVILMLVFDSISRLDGYPGSILPFFNYWGNLLIFLFNPVVSSLWVLYAYQYKRQTAKFNKWIIIVIVAVNIANAVMVILSQRYGWFYYIDSENIYHRGPLFLLSTVFTFFLIFVATYLVYKNRNRIERKHYFALLFFLAPPFLCVILQILLYGFSFVYNGVTLSALIIFLFIQNQDIFTDYLTGVANRKKLELYLRKMINNSVPHQTFSAIMIDLDNFKAINDTFGHKVGDEALQTAAELLRGCLQKQDFIARYGGDEFYVVLGTSDIDVLNGIVRRIRTSIEDYNSKSNLPYKFGLSMGYAIYEYGMNADDFINMIDKLMYEHKHND